MIQMQSFGETEMTLPGFLESQASITDTDVLCE